MIEHAQFQERIAEMLDEIESEWRCDKEAYKRARRALGAALDSLVRWVEEPPFDPDAPPAIDTRPFTR